MPSGTCSRRAGFADTIRLLASLIVLGCSIAGRTAENAFGKDKNRNRERHQLAQRAWPQNARRSALLWHGNGPARHSVPACRVSQFGRCIGVGILRRAVAGASVSAPLVSDEFREPLIRRFGRALERLEIDVNYAEAAAVAFRPLEVIDGRPDEIAAQVFTGRQRE